MIYLGAFVGSLVSVFLKGIQHKNVQHNLYKATFVTSSVIGLVDATLIGLVVRGGWTTGLATGMAAGSGMVLAMWAHNRVTGK